MKRDLLSECNDQGMTVPEFESLFCKRCKNKECQRAGWATSNWEDRISTQVDRFLANPNIANQSDSTRWEGIVNFIPLSENEANSWEVTSPKPIETVSESNKIEGKIETVIEPQPVIEHKSKALNTPAQKSIIIGDEPLPSVADTDPWSVPSNKVTIGGTFKMGK
jgi:hypothetical protein